jgi:hypothetical protein
MRAKVAVAVGLVIGILAGTLLGVYVSSSFTTSRTIGGTVTVTGSQGLVLNTTSLSFGGMSANQTRTVGFKLSNVGCCLLNLSYATSMGNLPAPSVLKFGSIIGGGTYLTGLPNMIPANSSIVYGVQLTLGTMAVYGRTYSFNVTITAFT